MNRSKLLTPADRGALALSSDLQLCAGLSKSSRGTKATRARCMYSNDDESTWTQQLVLLVYSVAYLVVRHSGYIASTLLKACHNTFIIIIYYKKI